MPQLVPSHVVVPPVAVGQAVHDVPQLITDVFITHAVPQRCWPDAQPVSAGPTSPMRASLPASSGIEGEPQAIIINAMQETRTPRA
jgi:hypothetical protein